VPFEGTLTEVIEQKTSADPVAVTSLTPGVPDDLADVCMALLSRDPLARLSGLEAFRRKRPLASAVTPGGLGSSRSIFIGRGQPLDSLTAAFDAVKAGGSRSVYVHGPSGIGKTALVQYFFDRHVRSQGCLALRSRCHEHESVPYKGLDGVIDGLSRYLSGLPHEELARVMPPDGPALARLFPVMERATGSASLAPTDEADPLGIRRRAFAALRELLRNIATRAPLVIEIDDFHWADADSAASIAALMRPPESPPLLLVLSFRGEEIDTKPFLRTLVDQADMWTRVSLPVTPLSDAEAGRLISTLLPDRTAGELQRHDIVREAKGNPFLVEELVRSVALGGAARSGTPLEEILERRLAGLPPESRVFLETLAVCGRPILAARISEACGLSGDERPLVARLRAAHFLRRSRSPEHVEIYHDRLRETLAASVSKETAGRIHALMAQILVAHGDDDPEALFEHYRAAGRAALAAREAVAAAQRASVVLAFDRAAAFLRDALALDPGADQHLAWMLGLAVALENAGRPAEAADAYLAAAREVDEGRHVEWQRKSGADERRRVEWQRKAAELLLMGGHIDRGLETIGTVLPVVGVRLARGPRSALASILLGRARLAWRGLGFESRDESAIPPNTLLCIDTCWAVSTGLMLVDTLRAASVELRHLRIALDAGEPYRVARALALEACLSAASGGREGIARSAAFAARAQAVAEGVRHPHVLALSSLTAGVAAFVLAEWVKATELCERALTMLRDECRGVVWELTLAQNFYLGSLFYRGHIRRVSQWIPGLLESARDRGNLYFETELTTRFGMVWLAADDPDAGERQADAANARWSADGFHRQHYNHLQARVQTALYRGRAADAWRLAERQVTSVRQSWWLRVQIMRIETAYLQARCALGVAAEGRDVRRMLAVAARDADRLAREDTRWSNPLALLVRATVAHLRGQEDVAAARLSDAVEAFGAADMRLYEAVARRRLGILVGGERGRTLQREAEDWLAAEAIRNPAAMSRLLAPGLPER
jgi:tetratricopeptide (TPR) repeat protein